MLPPEEDAVLNPEAMTLWHRHGDDWAEMTEEDTPHGPEAHDAERTWLSEGRVFRCSSCNEEVRVTGAPEES